jgi:hypothetical protein
VQATEKIKAHSVEEAVDLLRNLTLTIAADDDEVTAKAEYEKFGWGSRPVQVDFLVTIPQHFDVTVKTSGGDVKIGDLTGKAHARTSGGNVSLGKIEGDVDAHSSGGNITLDEGAGAVRLGTSGGNIHVGRAVGRTDLDTSGGDIRIGSVENAVRAETSGGNVSGAILGALKGDCVLRTSGGQVRVAVDASAAFRLEASTSGGEVDASGLTIRIEKGGLGKSRLAGKVNGGGPLLQLHSSGGNITVETR